MSKGEGDYDVGSKATAVFPVIGLEEGVISIPQLNCISKNAANLGDFQVVGLTSKFSAENVFHAIGYPYPIFDMPQFDKLLK